MQNGLLTKVNRCHRCSLSNNRLGTRPGRFGFPTEPDSPLLNETGQGLSPVGGFCLGVSAAFIEILLQNAAKTPKLNYGAV